MIRRDEQDVAENPPTLQHVLQGDLFGRGDEQDAIGELEAGQGDLVEAVGQIEHNVAEVALQRRDHRADVLAGDRLAFFGACRRGEDAQRAAVGQQVVIEPAAIERAHRHW